MAVNTSLYAKALAVKEGCEYYVEHYFLPLILETDSLALTKIVRCEWDYPWNIVMIFKGSGNVLKGKQIQMQNTF